MDINPESTPHQRQSSVEKVAFLAAEFGFLSVLGSWGAAWVGVAVPAILVEIYCGSHPRSLATLMPAGLWLVFSRFTGNRELFFPYAMYVAAFVIQPNLGQKPLPWQLQRGLLVDACFSPFVGSRTQPRVYFWSRALSLLELSLLRACFVGMD